MKNIEIDSIVGLFYNLVLIVALILTWGGSPYLIMIIPITAIVLEAFVLINDNDKNKLEYWQYVVVGSKIGLLVTPVMVLLNSIFSVCLFCDEAILYNLLLFAIIVLLILSTIYVRFFKLNKKVS